MFFQNVQVVGVHETQEVTCKFRSFLGVPNGCRWMGWITKTGSSILGVGGSAYTLASLSLTCGCLCKSKIHRQMDAGGFQ